MTTMYKITKLTVSLVALVFAVSSCSKEEANQVTKGNQNGVTFALSESEFGAGESLVAKASNRVGASTPLVATQEIKAGAFTITAELTEDVAASNGLKATTGKRAAVNRLVGAVKYRIVAYKQDGTYVDQAVGDASDASQVFFGDKLIKGQKYNFVIYSMGSTTDAPAPAPATNMNAGTDMNKGLYLETPNTENGGDFMYAIEKDVTIIGDGTPTPLTTPLQHMFTRVNILIDNSDATGIFGQAGYQKGGYVSEVSVNGSMSDQGGQAEIWVNPSTGKYMIGTDNIPATVTNINTTAKTFIINQVQHTTSSRLDFTIDKGSIKIGNDVNPKPIFISFTDAGKGLRPGYSYTLKMRFNSDRYVDANNNTLNATDANARYAVIGGYRWDRYNLGAVSTNPSSYSPDVNPSIKGLYGNFYQFGRAAIAATTSSGDGAIAGWNSAAEAGNAWNSGTETVPVKTATDPCGTGDRMPTLTEYAKLRDNTLHSSFGNWGPFLGGTDVGLSDYTAAHVMTSKKSSDIKLTFPAAGWRNRSTGQQVDRQAGGIYHTSTAVAGTDQSRYPRLFEASMDESQYYKSAGYTVRCIQNK